MNARKTEKLRAKVTGGERNGGGPTTVTVPASTTEGWRGQVRGVPRRKGLTGGNNTVAQYGIVKAGRSYRNRDNKSVRSKFGSTDRKGVSNDTTRDVAGDPTNFRRFNRVDGKD